MGPTVEAKEPSLSPKARGQVELFRLVVCSDPPIKHPHCMVPIISRKSPTIPWLLRGGWILGGGIAMLCVHTLGKKGHVADRQRCWEIDVWIWRDEVRRILLCHNRPTAVDDGSCWPLFNSLGSCKIYRTCPAKFPLIEVIEKGMDEPAGLTFIEVGICWLKRKCNMIW